MKIKKTIKTKAIIFDLDGTLLESMHIWQNFDWNSIAKAYKSEVVLKPGVYDFLKDLQKNKIRMVLATATDRYLMEPALHRNKMYDFFETIFTCGEVGASKETPKIYDKAVEYLGVKKEEVWVFEDAFYAIKTASMEGYKVAAIKDKWVGKLSYGKSITRSEIMEFADVYIEDYTKITVEEFLQT